MGVRAWPYFLGHWFVPAVICALSAFIALWLEHASVPMHTSANLTVPFEDSGVPFWLVHIADLHISDIRPDLAVRELLQLSNITQRCNPGFLALGGDLVDALNKTYIVSFHEQY